jgi:undecaprenyl-diphosphatase
MTVLEAVLIAIVEGVTEFLPVSSTGHMILTQGILGMKSDDFLKAFTVNIQFGAILSVVVLYWKRFFQSIDFYIKLLIAFLPAALIGFLLGDQIDAMLESVPVVAVSLLLGGIVLLKVDDWFKANELQPEKEVKPKNALLIGFFQCLALIPGVSRSAATIIGGMQSGFNRKQAAEFSFFLAVPTMFAASGYKLLKNHEAITSDNLSLLLIGNAVAFIVALLAIKTFIGMLTRYGFKVFGYYRIIVGAIILIMLALDIPLDIH